MRKISKSEVGEKLLGSLDEESPLEEDIGIYDDK